MRLERLLISDEAAPSSTALLAEQILHTMITESQTDIILNGDVSYTVASLEKTMLGFDDNARNQLVQQAELAEGGIEAATNFLFDWDSHNANHGYLCSTKVALRVTLRDLQGTPGKVMWEHGRLLPCVVKLLGGLFETQHPLVSLHDEIAIAALELIRLLIATNRLTSADFRPIVRCLISLVSTQGVGQQTIDASRATIEALSKATIHHWKKNVRATVLQTLMDEGVSLHGVADPIKHLAAVVDMLIQTLAGVDRATEVTKAVLPTLESFARLWRLLDVSQKLRCTRSLLMLDEGGVFGIGEWLANEEMDNMTKDLVKAEGVDNEIMVGLLISQVLDYSLPLILRSDSNFG